MWETLFWFGRRKLADQCHPTVVLEGFYSYEWTAGCKESPRAVTKRETIFDCNSVLPKYWGTEIQCVSQKSSQYFHNQM